MILWRYNKGFALHSINKTMHHVNVAAGAPPLIFFSCMRDVMLKTSSRHHSSGMSRTVLKENTSLLITIVILSKAKQLIHQCETHDNFFLFTGRWSSTAPSHPTWRSPRHHRSLASGQTAGPTQCSVWASLQSSSSPRWKETFLLHHMKSQPSNSFRYWGLFINNRPQKWQYTFDFYFILVIILFI